MSSTTQAEIAHEVIDVVTAEPPVGEDGLSQEVS